MKRSRLERKTELRNTTPFESGRTPLAAGPKRVAFVSKRPTVTPEERRARKLVGLRSRGRCEGCLRPGPTEWAHRVSRAQGGPWSAVNGLALCGDLTGGHAPTAGGGCHPWSHSAAGRPICEKRGWILRRNQDPATVPVLFARGLVLLAADGSVTPYNREAA